MRKDSCALKDKAIVRPVTRRVVFLLSIWERNAAMSERSPRGIKSEIERAGTPSAIDVRDDRWEGDGREEDREGAVGAQKCKSIGERQPGHGGHSVRSVARWFLGRETVSGVDA